MRVLKQFLLQYQETLPAYYTCILLSALNKKNLGEIWTLK